jgi:hypothetical protein
LSVYSGRISSNSLTPALITFPRNIEDGPIAFAMNAGMYEEDLSPVGLYVEDGKTTETANRKKRVW